MNQRIKQFHNGSGDNVAGDKIETKNNRNKESALPIWAQWAGLIILIFATVWGIYIYLVPIK